MRPNIDNIQIQGKIHQDYLSLNNTKVLKGIFALAILLHHLYQYCVDITNIYPFFGGALQCLGYLSVGMFFFFNGYGLMLSSRNEGYISTFLQRRILPLYAFYVLLIFTYTIYEILLGIPVSAVAVAQSFLYGYTLVPLAWYLQVTFVIYLIYWFVFRYIKNDVFRLSVMGGALLLICIFSSLYGLTSTWYENIFCVLTGMLWFYRKTEIDDVLKKRALLIVIGSAVLFVSCTLLQVKFGVICKMISSIFFSVMAISVTFVLVNTSIINNSFTQFIGNYSLEIYVCQGFFLLLCVPCGVLNNPYIFVVITIVGTSVIAIVMKPIYLCVTRTVRKLFNVEK